MSINNEAINAVQTFKEQSQGEHDEYWVKIACQEGQPVAMAEYPSIAAGMLAIRSLTDDGIKITAVSIKVKANGQLQEIINIYPVEDEHAHTGGCCGCGG